MNGADRRRRRARARPLRPGGGRWRRSSSRVAGGGRASDRAQRLAGAASRATARCTSRRARRPGRSSSASSRRRSRERLRAATRRRACAGRRLRFAPGTAAGAEPPRTRRRRASRPEPTTEEQRAEAGESARRGDRGRKAAQSGCESGRCAQPREAAGRPLFLIHCPSPQAAFCRAFLMTEASLHRKGHHRSRGPRAGPAAPGHVHRLDGPARPPSPRLRGGRQLRRRGPRGAQRAHRGHPPSRQLGHGPRLRVGHPGRHHGGAGAPGADGRADEAPRRRQVRRRGLQGLRRPARRRRLGRERALRVAGRGGAPRRQDLPPGVRARRAVPSSKRARRRRPPARRSRSCPTRDLRRGESSGRPRRSSSACARRRS